MAQTVVLWGAAYSSVPALIVPSSNGTVQFTDVTDTTATAADVAEGSYFYTSAGVRTPGTGSGGGVDGDNLAYGGVFVGSAIVGSAVLIS